MPDDDYTQPLILVADDESFILKYIKHVLQLANCEVMTVCDIEEAWIILQRRHAEFELVMTDIVMPGSFDGLELADRIHHLDPDLPVTLITGARSEADPRAADMAERQMVLMKPFQPKQLVDFVTARLRRVSSSIVQ